MKIKNMSKMEAIERFVVLLKKNESNSVYGKQLHYHICLDKAKNSLVSRYLFPLTFEGEENMFKVDMYTDGSSKGNPGPSGVGIVLLCNGRMREISKPIGKATNNQAEMRAVIEGISVLTIPAQTRLTLYTDSQLIEGLLTKEWKAKLNKKLADQMYKSASKCSEIKVIKVKGHSEDELNNRADALAKEGSINKTTDKVTEEDN